VLRRSLGWRSPTEGIHFAAFTRIRDAVALPVEVR
jgi:hypothetical protein